MIGTGDGTALSSEVWAGVFTDFKALRALQLHTGRISQASQADDVAHLLFGWMLANIMSMQRHTSPAGPV
jgi:hypothetical protein